MEKERRKQEKIVRKPIRTLSYSRDTFGLFGMKLLQWALEMDKQRFLPIVLNLKGIDLNSLCATIESERNIQFSELHKKWFERMLNVNIKLIDIMLEESQCKLMEEGDDGRG